jgi:ATP-dependent phosphofructokinase / diphosphate-dependent phosphofructokinase
VIDPATGRGRLRSVDIETESYQVARDYMGRIGKKDFADEDWLAQLADASNVSLQEFTAHFGKFAEQG